MPPAASEPAGGRSRRTATSAPDPVTDSVWLRPARGRRGEQPALSREQIVRAAIELLDADGPGGLSMRRLGTKLGAGATSVYWHVANKDELLDLAMDEVMAEIYVPEPGDASWRIGASVYANGLHAMLLRHPWVIGLLGVRPNIGPNALRLSDRLVAVFTAAGVTGLELAYASGLLGSYAVGSALSVAAVTETTRRTGVSVKQMFEDMQPYMDATAEDHPNHHRWWHESGGPDLDPEQLWTASFAFGLERSLDGLELWLARQAE
jgi:AcrR family transcriptional regulator